MFTPRIIPVLLLSGGGLVKTKKFRNPVYIGDPINTLRIFNDKEVDEIIVLDIDASKQGNNINFSQVEEVLSEGFMPICYGGGISSLEDCEKLFYSGCEKVSISSCAIADFSLIEQVAKRFGSQSVVFTIDIELNFFGKYQAKTINGTRKADKHYLKLIELAVDSGAGEVMVNFINNDGLMRGFDTKLIKTVTDAVSVPVIACGGASTLKDCEEVILKGGATSAAAGSMFVFYGKYKNVLITYPDYHELQGLRSLSVFK